MASTPGQEAGPRKRQCTDCKRKKKRPLPDHLIEKRPGEESKDEEEGEAKREEDPHAHIRLVVGTLSPRVLLSHSK
jgi:hypothetical protein